MGNNEISDNSFEDFKTSISTSEQTFNRFIEELEVESDRGAAIFAGTFFECTLKIILEELLNKVKSTKSLLEDANGGLNTFSAKINICYSLGFITLHEYQALNILKKVRNQFAHNFEYKFSFEDKKISAQCSALKLEIEGLKLQKFETARQTFIESVKHLHQKLIDRHYEVITFSAPTFKIENYLNDPLAYQRVGQEQRDLEEFRKLNERDSKWGRKENQTRNITEKK
ncbi:MltR family transcriptional regulator [Mucilaginibacter pocheonensis]|uniref:DNA-binding MltR family transcriptional regulator n=1 Tax=Mucilaginibacter pocheonensis TaxID=398050 RepID=A0ABU1TE62_9SPHI|nr:MltR family transcriptional regulator [Mucilaginibacter pocheonensis]MDR6943704.1 DNA-binding MltR family transcriptional regulator [Mucilaginibacter pocheonensis]